MFGPQEKTHFAKSKKAETKYVDVFPRVQKIADDFAITFIEIP
jgi:hypothetical protein